MQKIYHNRKFYKVMLLINKVYYLCPHPVRKLSTGAQTVVNLSILYRLLT